MSNQKELKRIVDETLYLQNRTVKIQIFTNKLGWKTIKEIENVQSTIYSKNELLIQNIDNGEAVNHIEKLTV